MASTLPDYVKAAQPVPQANRAAWFLNTAPTYAGIMLWFVFWQDVPVGSGIHPKMGQFSEFAGGILSHGLVVAFVGLILAALICHFLFFLVPGLLGLKTGLPLYIVGTSTYGVRGGFFMPGFLMGVLQFGWLGVNSFFAALMLCAPWGQGVFTPAHIVVSIVWAVAAAFMGLKGIQYVARVATFLPLIPLGILVILFCVTIGGIGKFDEQALVEAGEGRAVEVKQSEFARQRVPGARPLSEQRADNVVTRTYRTHWVEVEKSQVFVTQGRLSVWGVIALISTYVVGFFATAGAAGVDFGMNNRNAKDVQLGGLVGIALATVLSGGLALLVVAGIHGAGTTPDGAVLRAADADMMAGILSPKMAAVFSYLLAIAAFPPACFSAFIAANSFKTTLPKVNPFISVGCGTAVSILLAVTGLAGDVIGMFTIIGASFGPVCGAMAADYLLAGRKWAGPRAGFNLAGWISWVVGFLVGVVDLIPGIADIPAMVGLPGIAGIPGMAGIVPCPPVMAFVVGFVLYYVLSNVGLQSQTLEMPAAGEPATETAE